AASNIPVREASAGLQLSGFTRVEANAQQQNKLIGSNSAAHWEFVADKAADISYDGESENSFSFSGFSDLTGGDKTDIFALNNFYVAQLDGADGSDTIVSGSLSSAQHEWIIEEDNQGRWLKSDGDVAARE